MYGDNRSFAVSRIYRNKKRKKPKKHLGGVGEESGSVKDYSLPISEEISKARNTFLLSGDEEAVPLSPEEAREYYLASVQETKESLNKFPLLAKALSISENAVQNYIPIKEDQFPLKAVLMVVSDEEKYLKKHGDVSKTAVFDKEDKLCYINLNDIKRDFDQYSRENPESTKEVEDYILFHSSITIVHEYLHYLSMKYNLLDNTMYQMSGVQHYRANEKEDYVSNTGINELMTEYLSFKALVSSTRMFENLVSQAREARHGAFIVFDFLDKYIGEEEIKKAYFSNDIYGSLRRKIIEDNLSLGVAEDRTRFEKFVGLANKLHSSRTKNIDKDFNKFYGNLLKIYNQKQNKYF